ncbi:Glucan endo-1,3-alpha-glucosidase agn1 [Tolypocladium ophioglossoides CBS 100239]|uniref:Glucan endo-1,3-alpha-glucosidase agn1 n=1 Tax=Tolypocladium ophioglossoides (strain CBS 100239) TaxID=1163406 RepID=A0A0L0N2R4_TOLOC|nr:Glucan endo-1,3-alpha-glucosidase agn1 [Tolypocladium ophioglossoides CBS 100239]
MRLSHPAYILGGLAPGALSVALQSLHGRAVAGQGWSLQSATCPANSQSCGNGSCCPQTSQCQATGNGEVVACCPNSNNCRGSVEGSPTCADPAWSLWAGQYGNGFCCQVGLVGAYSSGQSTAGSCASSVPAGYTAAQLKTQGTGSPTGGNPPPVVSPTGGNPPPVASPTSTSATPSQPSPPAGGIAKAVFAHYMVGSMTQDEATQDVRDARSAGFNAFALNTHDISSAWAVNALTYLFNAADQTTDFKLFISFDMSWKTITPSDIPAFLVNYTGRASYYKVNGNPFVSTYFGQDFTSDQWNTGFRQPLKTRNVTPFFVPDFDRWPGYPNNFVNSYPVIDGAFSWESAWPAPGSGVSPVSDSIDSNVLQQTRAAGKVYMMPLSSFQFKYMSDGKWYRIGEVNLPQRMEQILALQPDFVEFLTWNDAGEGHYIGNVFPDAISCCPDIQSYANNFDHKGWQQLVKPFMDAYRNGATDSSKIMPPSSSPVGTLWYRTLLTSASCSSTVSNHEQGQDAINYGVILPSSGYTINVYSNGKQLGSFPGKAGLNYQSVLGLQTGGDQRIDILDSSNNKVATATGTKNVLAQSLDSTLCNWNYEVVGLSSA